jgi:hypothetical protein
MEVAVRALLIVALLAGAAFATGCQSSTTTSGVERRSIYGQPCNTRIREAGLCRSFHS